MKENSRLALSFVISFIIHILIVALVIFLPKTEFQKESKINLQNILILKRGFDTDPNQNKEGARKPKIASVNLQKTPSPQLMPPSTSSLKQPLKNEIKTKETNENAIQSIENQNIEFKPSTLDFESLSFSDFSVPNQSIIGSKDINMGQNDETLNEIHELYGREFGDLGSAEKDYIKNNLRNIGRITQRYLRYPGIAAYFEQSGSNAIEFYLHPNGDITNLKIIKSSGFDSFDKQSLLTVNLAYKDYPRPKEKVLIRINVRYLLDY